MYELARQHFPKTYLDLLKLRMPTYVKLVLTNEFPRSQLTTHLGPRASALLRSVPQPRFRREVRVAISGSVPDAPLPGGSGAFARASRLHLRRNGYVPAAVPAGGRAATSIGTKSGAWRSSSKTGGHSLLDTIGHSRDRLSEEMMFEEAARQHKRFEKVQEVLKLRDDLARDIDHLHGVAITPSAAPDAVELWIVREGHWQPPQRLSFEVQEGKPVSLDGKLRDIFGRAAHAPARHARAPGISGPAGALVSIRAGATASGWPSRHSKTCLIASWCTPFRAWRGRPSP